MHDYKKELDTAKKAATKAGHILLSNKSNLNKILSTTRKDIKLQADVSAEAVIKDIIKSESTLPILAEESGLSSEKISSTFWVVDPLDGTANYSRNIPICCVSIGLISNLKPVLGVIYDFNNDDLYEGSIDTNALLNNNEISVSKVENFHDGVLLTGLPNNTDYSDSALLKMVKDFQNWRKVRMIGSAAMASVYVAAGKAEAYKENGIFLWDIAAGAAIVEAAGGKVSISNHQSDFRVDAYFTNNNLEK